MCTLSSPSGVANATGPVPEATGAEATGSEGIGSAGAVGPATGGGESYLLFRVGGQDLGWPTRRVCHLLEQPDIFPVFDGPAWFAGLLRLPGSAVAAIDLRCYLRLSGEKSSRGEPANRHAAITVNLPHATPEFTPIALLVDRFLVTERIRPADIRPLREGRDGSHFRRYSIGSWRGRSRPCYLLSPERLVAQEELELVRAWVLNRW